MFLDWMVSIDDRSLQNINVTADFLSIVDRLSENDEDRHKMGTLDVASNIGSYSEKLDGSLSTLPKIRFRTISSISIPIWLKMSVKLKIMLETIED